MGNRAALGLSILRVCLGVFLLFEGLGKLGWFLDAGELTRRLRDWHASGVPVSRWYLETVCLPYAWLFARLVPAGELAAGAALVAGAFTRPAAGLALLMVLNFHLASSALFKYSFLTNGYGLPVVGGLAALMLGAVNLPFSLKR